MTGKLTRDQRLIFAIAGIDIVGFQESPKGNYWVGIDVRNNNASYSYPENATVKEIIQHTNEKRKEFGLIPAENGDTGTKTIHQSSQED